MSTYSGFRYPSESIAHAVYLYHRFTLSFREVEEVLAYRGIEVSYETIRQWCMKYGSGFARKSKKKRVVTVCRGLLITTSLTRDA